jgi:hypothetical protein
VWHGKIAATRQSAAKMQYGRGTRYAGHTALIQQLIPEGLSGIPGSVSTGAAATSAWAAAATTTGATTSTATARGAILGFIYAQRASAH